MRRRPRCVDCGDTRTTDGWRCGSCLTRHAAQKPSDDSVIVVTIFGKEVIRVRGKRW